MISAPRRAKATDLVYMTINGSELLMDVYTPDGEGPWPVVVALHGVDSNAKNGQDTVSVAQAAAAEGMVVFAPSWIDWNPPGPFPITLDVFEGWKSTANCAVAVAQQSAGEYGGGPANTVVYGFSAGAGIALAAAVEPTPDPIPGCEADSPPEPLAGAVLGDGEYWLHSQNFDLAFASDVEAMRAQLEPLIDATHWPAGLDTKFFLWVAESGTSPRGIDDPSDESGWLAPRDSDGSIQRDLERLDQLEDGVVTYVDAGELLALRLSEAGIDATLDEYPGGHTVSEKVPELIALLSAAVAQ